MALNKVMLIGNVGNDPEVRYLESNPQNPATNAKVASFRLATTERYRDRSGELRENTEWHSIVVWRNNADIVEKYVHKGSQIYIEGKLRTRQWTDQTGNKRYTTEVVADNIQLLGKRPEGDQQQGGYTASAPQASSYSGPGYDAPASAAPSVAPAPAPAPQPQVSPSYQGPLPAAEPSVPVTSAAPSAPVTSAAPSVAPAPAPQPQVSPSYQGPLPAAEPSDDLPF